MRALIIGADGMIGAALTDALLRRGDRVSATSRRPGDARPRRLFVDLANATFPLDSLPSCDVAFLCAAMTRLADCRSAPELAARINAEQPVRIARHLAARGSRLVFLSTAAVFDCREPRMRADRQRRPTSLYGRLKAVAEDGVLELGPQTNILRLTKVLTRGSILLRQWTGALAAGETVTAFADHRIAPLALASVIETLLAVGDLGKGGVYQMSGAVDVSYAEIARHIAARVGADETLVRAVSAIDAGVAPEEVLPFTSLHSGRLAALTGFQAPEPYVLLDTVLETHA